MRIKKTFLLVLSFFAFFMETNAQIQIDQLGLNIDGNTMGDRLSWSVSLSSDGNRVALGAFTDNDDFRGYVRVYENVQGVWTLVGAQIDGEAAVDQSGISVAISGDGKRIAIGSTGNDGAGNNSGHVRVFEEMSGTWMLVGDNLNGEAAGDSSGRAVSLSASGHRVAIGAIGNDGAGENAGQVRVYEDIAGTWVSVGTDIDGEAAGDLSGRALSLSADGLRVAIGARNNDGNGANAGHVRIYEDVNGVWTQLGLDINGESVGDQSGHSVSLNASGNRVAIGAMGNDSNGDNSGHVRVYEEVSGSWAQMGSDIDGLNTGDEAGRSVSLNDDGTRVTIGANGYANNTGIVRIYDLNSGGWAQIGTDLVGENEGDEFGWFVSLNGTGDVIAIGAPYNDGSAPNTGRTKLFELCDFTFTCPDDLIVAGNDSGVFTIDDYTGLIEYDCSSSSDISFSQDPPVGTMVSDPSTTTITITATDVVGNSNICSFNLIVDQTLSIDGFNFTQNSVRLYPNPSVEFVNLDAGSTTIDKVEVYDLTGRKVRALEVAATKAQINLASLEASVYLLQIYNGNSMIVKRFVKK